MQVLRARFDKLLLNNQSGLLKEYNMARTVSESHPTYSSRLTVSTPEVLARNRYRDVITLEDTRVRLLSNESDYINANLVQAAKVETIVCQAPLEHTTEHFWEMCWEQQVPLVVMLTDFVEPFHHGMREKCHKYFNDKAVQSFGPYQVRVAHSEEIAPGWAKRTLVLTRGESATSREIVHLHCTSWPDFGSLQHNQLAGLVQALEAMEQTRARHVGCRPIVHCSAGIGRSGTFVALEALLVLAKEGKWDDVDPLKVVPLLRNQRPGMVQTTEQYGMIYQALLSILSQ